MIFILLNTGMLRVFDSASCGPSRTAVNDVSRMDAVQDQVNRPLTARHNGNEDFFVRNMAGRPPPRLATSAQNTLTILLGSVAAISPGWSACWRTDTIMLVSALPNGLRETGNPHFGDGAHARATSCSSF